MTTIAVLGTGLLGAGFVESLLSRGHTVRVWNRTASKTEPLVERGAVPAADPAEAVQGATHVHIVLSADDAVDQVVDALRPALGANVPVIDHSTNSPARVAERAAKLRGEGVRYVPAPVFMSPTDARESTGMMVFAASEADAKELHDHLDAMTGKLMHVGDRPEVAAAYKIAGNSIYFAMTAAMNDVLAIGRGSGIDDATMLSLFDTFKPGHAIPGIGRHVSRGDRDNPSFELSMARKDARLMHEAAGDHQTIALPAVIAAMDRAIEGGNGARDFVAFTD